MKKTLAMFTAFVLCLSALTGCSGDTTASSAADAQSAAGTESDAGTESAAEGETEELSGSFTYWTFTDFSNNLVEAFEKENPGVDIEIQVFGGDEYKTKLLTTLQSGQDIPDMFDLEASYVYEFLDSDMLEDLTARGFEDLMSDFYPYVLSTSRDSNGTLKGVNFQTSPVCLWYLRDACEEWLGTSDPDEISSMLGSVEDIMKVAADVNEKSGGTVSLFGNMNDFANMMTYSFQPFVRDGKYEMTQDWLDLIDTMRDFYNSGYDPELAGWSEDWAAKWNAGELLMRVMPSWDYFTDWDANAGNVGIAAPFQKSYEGGTIVCMYSGSENKDLGDAFLRYLCSDEFQTWNMENNNQVPASQSVSKTLAEDFSAEDFGGQNLMAVYDEINAGISDVIPDKYTADLKSLFTKHATDGIKNGLSNDEIVANFQAEAKDRYPEIEGL